MIKFINGYVFRISLFVTAYLTFGYLKYKTYRYLEYIYLSNVILKYESKFGYWSPSYL